MLTLDSLYLYIHQAFTDLLDYLIYIKYLLLWAGQWGNGGDAETVPVLKILTATENSPIIMIKCGKCNKRGLWELGWGGDLNEESNIWFGSRKKKTESLSRDWGECVFWAERTACIMVENQTASPGYGDNLASTKTRMEKEFMKGLECQAIIWT